MGEGLMLEVWKGKENLINENRLKKWTIWSNLDFYKPIKILIDIYTNKNQ
jgi:hypothetical protein